MTPQYGTTSSSDITREDTAAARICGTTVAMSVLKKKLKAAFNSKATVGKDFRIERIGENQGFLSITVRMYMDWQGDDANLHPPTMVLKIPSTAAMLRNVKGSTLEEVQEQHDRLAMILTVGHVSETSFYRLVMKENLWHQAAIPICFHAQHFRRNGAESGYLLLEDLGPRAVIEPLYRGLGRMQVKAVLCQLAKLHAYSLTNTSWNRGAHKIFRSTFLEVQRAYPAITRARISRAIAQLKNDFPEWFVDENGNCLLTRLEKVVDDQLTRYNGEAVHAASGMLSVLVHGDLWTNNILWEEEEDGVASDRLLSVIDWQNVHSGNVAEDLVRLLGSSVSPKIRRTHLHEFVSFYLSTLSQMLRGRGVISMPFTHQQIVDAYERMFGQGLLIMLPSLNACADEGNGLLGEENIKERQCAVLERTRALIQDFFLYRERHDGW